MSGKPKPTRHLTSVTGKGGRAVPGPSAQLQRLQGEFTAWARLHVEQAGDQESLSSLWHDLSIAVATAGSVGLTDIGSWTADDVERTAQALADSIATVAVSIDADVDDGAGMDALVGQAVSALGVFLEFLGETGRWQGTEEDFHATLQAVEDASPVDVVVTALSSLVTDPPAGPADERAALLRTPLAQHLLALLTWVGPRHPVTQRTGQVRRSDLAEAAALVGVDLSAAKPASMGDLPRLPHLWRALVDAELVELGSTVARCTATGTRVTSPSGSPDEEAVHALAVAAVAALERILTEPALRPWVPSAGVLAIPVLTAALLSASLPAEAVAVAANLGTSEGLDAELGLSLGAVDGARLLGPLLDELVSLGMLARDPAGAISVPAGLERLVATATLRALEAASEGALEVPAGIDPFTTPLHPGLHALHLRIELVGAHTPVVREVLVDAASRVGDLHEVVQAVMEWDDSHAWRFEVPNGARSAEPVSERRALRSVLKTTRDALIYTYDFGDSWTHRITLLAALDADQADSISPRSLPRCLAAVGRGPEEDCGGVWGWAELVRSVTDPAHPEHAESREWLGLADGEPFDATTADVEEYDRRLAVLR